MDNAVVLNTDDIKKILADYFNVDEKSVIKSQYSYIVLNSTIKEFGDEH